MHLTYVITRPNVNKQQFISEDEDYIKSKYILSEADEKILAGYESKSMAYVYRQLIQQV